MRQCDAVNAPSTMFAIPRFGTLRPDDPYKIRIHYARYADSYWESWVLVELTGRIHRRITRFLRSSLLRGRCFSHSSRVHRGIAPLLVQTLFAGLLRSCDGTERSCGRAT
ncbi:hypothetical protein Salat_2986300 [Sesamum alatum]|uniref:Uncharacterized protein n=1 Tax=Sesamum alatum TaxID=300844 RepID=A0AAE1XJ50_9LAMI|nr:hypothetical protein Salat_2999300 [Sesamum alatum]KAK4412347.1 hypothetical protein Salat_2986300 [Sesamum alatum]